MASSLFFKRIIVGLTTVIAVSTGTISGMAASGNISLTDATKKYECVFNNYDDTELYKCEVEPTHTAIYRGKTPTKPSDEIYQYEFAGWDKPTHTIRKNEIFTAQFTKKRRDYETRFLNYDGTLLYTAYVQSGDPAFYVGDTPTRPESAGNTYIFNGWDRSTELPVYHDTTYVAEFKVEIKEFNVYFFDYDEVTLLYTDKVAYGAAASYNGPDLVGPDAETGYHYEFIGWSDPFNDVVEDMTTVAMFEKVKNKYEVTFKNWDEETLYVAEVEHGATAIYEGSTPVKEPDQYHSYVFSGWDKSLKNVTEEMVVHAQFMETDPDCYVTFKDYKGNTLDTVIVPYGGDAVYPHEAPQRPSTEQYDYEFIEWDRSLEQVHQSFDTFPIYKEILRKYPVHFLNYDSTELQVVEIDYGESAENAYTEATPEKPEDENYTYKFIGWDQDLSCITDEIETYALFEAIPKKYVPDSGGNDGSGSSGGGGSGSGHGSGGGTGGSGGGGSGGGGGNPSTDDDDEIDKFCWVRFYNYDKEYLDQDGVRIGRTAVYAGETPTRANDLKHKDYVFCSWDKSLTNVKGNFKTYAQYEIHETSVTQYIVSFRNDDDTLLYECVCEENDLPTYGIDREPVSEKNPDAPFLGWGIYSSDTVSSLKRVTESYTVYAKYGKKVTTVVPDGLDGDIDNNFDIDTEIASLFDFRTEVEGNIYFRESSFGDYSPSTNSFSRANLFTSKINQNFSPLNLTNNKLQQIGEPEYDIEINYYTQMPFTLSPSYSSIYNRSVSDVYVEASSDMLMNYKFIPETVNDELVKSMKLVGYSDSSISDLETEYREFAYDTYLTVSASERQYFLDYAEANNLSVDSINDICNIPAVIQEDHTYNETAADYPTGVDNVIYFMETAKEGVCQHFASALTLLYRSLGLPARYVVGYLGESTGSNQVCEVTSRNAHAWTEVYIDRVGWMIIDATPGKTGEEGGNPPPDGGSVSYPQTDDKKYNPFGPLEGDPLLTITVYPERKSKVYDGKKMNVSYKIEGTFLNPGDHEHIQIVEEKTDVGNHITRSYPIILNSGNYDVTSKYIGKVKMVYENYTIKKRPVTIITGSAEKVFDGEALECKEFDLDLCEYEWLDNYKVTCDFISSQTKPGYCNNVINNVSIIYTNPKNGQETNVTKNYNITVVYGTLTVYFKSE